MTNDLWKKIASLSEEDLRKELMKYPDIESLKKALKGYMSASEIRIKNKKLLVDKILERRKKGSFISEIGKSK